MLLSLSMWCNEVVISMISNIYHADILAISLVEESFNQQSSSQQKRYKVTT